MGLLPEVAVTHTLVPKHTEPTTQGNRMTYGVRIGGRVKSQESSFLNLQHKEISGMVESYFLGIRARATPQLSRQEKWGHLI